uniref:Glycosyltransferase 2-like domain-containing protein n=1 Tax=Chromera velia CCMP2878 TaxID=1169474 RepID=A0A0G4FYQ5_9ALVE|eukprot:Cvel_3926.t1-p1 / transcript=Cvel_3926.t1 / gene=Cvel_3926 / organism=Chromera_velia_CCMP2878 / gene_product=hypothetical protein / transcript_product=hypothetical protein / location=Cvel_scaffold166:97905-109337(-) / protein_length=1969 / sequence_SO=supercontig / SO=protein_coding / is_pseudo=false
MATIFLFLFSLLGSLLDRSSASRCCVHQHSKASVEWSSVEVGEKGRRDPEDDRVQRGSGDTGEGCKGGQIAAGCERPSPILPVCVRDKILTRPSIRVSSSGKGGAETETVPRRLTFFLLVEGYSDGGGEHSLTEGAIASLDSIFWHHPESRVVVIVLNAGEGEGTANRERQKNEEKSELEERYSDHGYCLVLVTSIELLLHEGLQSGGAVLNLLREGKVQYALDVVCLDFVLREGGVCMRPLGLFLNRIDVFATARNPLLVRRSSRQASQAERVLKEEEQDEGRGNEKRLPDQKDASDFRLDVLLFECRLEKGRKLRTNSVSSLEKEEEVRVGKPEGKTSPPPSPFSLPPSFGLTDETSRWGLFKRAPSDLPSKLPSRLCASSLPLVLARTHSPLGQRAFELLLRFSDSSLWSLMKERERALREEMVTPLDLAFSIAYKEHISEKKARAEKTKQYMETGSTRGQGDGIAHVQNSGSELQAEGEGEGEGGVEQIVLLPPWTVASHVWQDGLGVDRRRKKKFHGASGLFEARPSFEAADLDSVLSSCVWLPSRLPLPVSPATVPGVVVGQRQEGAAGSARKEREGGGEGQWLRGATPTPTYNSVVGLALRLFSLELGQNEMASNDPDNAERDGKDLSCRTLEDDTKKMQCRRLGGEGLSLRYSSISPALFSSFSLYPRSPSEAVGLPAEAEGSRRAFRFFRAVGAAPVEAEGREWGVVFQIWAPADGPVKVQCQRREGIGGLLSTSAAVSLCEWGLVSVRASSCGWESEGEGRGGETERDGPLEGDEPERSGKGTERLLFSLTGRPSEVNAAVSQLLLDPPRRKGGRSLRFLSLPEDEDAERDPVLGRHTEGNVEGGRKGERKGDERAGGVEKRQQKRTRGIEGVADGAFSSLRFQLLTLTESPQEMHTEEGEGEEKGFCSIEFHPHSTFFPFVPALNVGGTCRLVRQRRGQDRTFDFGAKNATAHGMDDSKSAKKGGESLKTGDCRRDVCECVRCEEGLTGGIGRKAETVVLSSAVYPDLPDSKRPKPYGSLNGGAWRAAETATARAVVVSETYTDTDTSVDTRRGKPGASCAGGGLKGGTVFDLSCFSCSHCLLPSSESMRDSPSASPCACPVWSLPEKKQMNLKVHSFASVSLRVVAVRVEDAVVVASHSGGRCAALERLRLGVRSIDTHVPVLLSCEREKKTEKKEDGGKGKRHSVRSLSKEAGGYEEGEYAGDSPSLSATVDRPFAFPSSRPDGWVSVKRHSEDISMFALGVPYDFGLSRSRNLMLSLVFPAAEDRKEESRNEVISTESANEEGESHLDPSLPVFFHVRFGSRGNARLTTLEGTGQKNASSLPGEWANSLQREMVLLLDDDFLPTHETCLPCLLERFLGGGRGGPALDVLGFPIREDERIFGAYRGSLREVGGLLVLEPYPRMGGGGAVDGTVRYDLVPMAFLGSVRRLAEKNIWMPTPKVSEKEEAGEEGSGETKEKGHQSVPFVLGEHERFFWDANEKGLQAAVWTGFSVGHFRIQVEETGTGGASTKRAEEVFGDTTRQEGQSGLERKGIVVKEVEFDVQAYMERKKRTGSLLNSALPPGVSAVVSLHDPVSPLSNPGDFNELRRKGVAPWLVRQGPTGAVPTWATSRLHGSKLRLVSLVVLSSNSARSRKARACIRGEAGGGGCEGSHRALREIAGQTDGSVDFFLVHSEEDAGAELEREIFAFRDVFIVSGATRKGGEGVGAWGGRALVEALGFCVRALGRQSLWTLVVSDDALVHSEKFLDLLERVEGKSWTVVLPSQGFAGCAGEDRAHAEEGQRGPSGEELKETSSKGDCSFPWHCKGVASPFFAFVSRELIGLISEPPLSDMLRDSFEEGEGGTECPAQGRLGAANAEGKGLHVHLNVSTAFEESQKAVKRDPSDSISKRERTTEKHTSSCGDREGFRRLSMTFRRWLEVLDVSLHTVSSDVVQHADEAQLDQGGPKVSGLERPKRS